MAREMGEIVFTLQQIMIAPLNIITGAYSTAVTLPEPQTMEITFEADTDQIKAQGYLQHLLSVITHGTFKLSQAGIPFDALEVLTGATRDDSGSTPNAIKAMRFGAGGSGLPYFGAVGRLVGEQSDDTWLGLPACKLDMIPGWKAEQNKFVIGESSGKFIANSAGLLCQVLSHETATAITTGNFAQAFNDYA